MLSSGVGSFLPHETCYLFNPGLIWLHGASDSVIALAYYAIPLEIMYFARRRRDLPFPLIFLAFAVFILGCGSTHLMDVVTLWYPAYWISGAIKAVTAVASVGTAILMVFVIPRGLALRSPAELEEINRKLTQEIGERRRAEAEVLKSRETLVRQERIRVAGQLASGIAHDLNNTLNVVSLRLNLLARDPGVKERHENGLRAIERAIADATRTVARVQELAKPRLAEEAQAIELSEIIVHAIDLARTAIEGGSSLRGWLVSIDSRVPASLPRVKGQPADLRQVFLNLLLNAADATREGKIEVESAVEDDFVVVRVLDEGTGIPSDKLPHVFEPFFTTKGPRGTGLGLSIAREVMQGLGGSIGAANRQHRGAVFTLRFPIMKAAAPSPTLVPSINSVAPRRFLLIDDDQDNLDALRDLLISAGHQADTALSGAEALELLRSGSGYDIVLCDLGMPGMNGWQVAEKVLEASPGQKFYIVTGWADGLDSTNARPTPISGLLAKPVTLADIEGVVACTLLSAAEAS